MLLTQQVRGLCSLCQSLLQARGFPLCHRPIGGELVPFCAVPAVGSELLGAGVALQLRGHAERRVQACCQCRRVGQQGVEVLRGGPLGMQAHLRPCGTAAATRPVSVPIVTASTTTTTTITMQRALCQHRHVRLKLIQSLAPASQRCHLCGGNTRGQGGKGRGGCLGCGAGVYLCRQSSHSLLQLTHNHCLHMCISHPCSKMAIWRPPTARRRSARWRAWWCCSSSSSCSGALLPWAAAGSRTCLWVHHIQQPAQVWVLAKLLLPRRNTHTHAQCVQVCALPGYLLQQLSLGVGTNKHVVSA